MFFNVEEGLDQPGEELVAPPPPRVLDDAAERRSHGFDPRLNVGKRKWTQWCAEAELKTSEPSGPTFLNETKLLWFLLSRSFDSSAEL